jgi:hypothetical protein
MKISFKDNLLQMKQNSKTIHFFGKVFIWWYLSISLPHSFEKPDLKVKFRLKSKSLAF